MSPSIARPVHGEKLPRVLLVATHPIQYQIPLFVALNQSREIDFSVLFIQIPSSQQQGVGFGVSFEWDIPLLEGYQWERAGALKGKGGLRGFFSTRIQRPDVLLNKFKPDVLISTGWQSWPLCQMLLAARRAKVPVVMRGESNALRSRPWATRVLHRALLSQCSAFLSIGQGNSAFYRSYGTQESRLFDTAYFVDNERFAATAGTMLAQRSELRLRWQVPENAVCFCFAGKLEAKKRIMDLLAALHLAQSMSAQSMHLLIVGTGEQMESARAFVLQHELPVTFTGFLNQTEIPAAYVAADCLVLPSDYGETWGLVVNEAMACGRPAIVSDRVGCGPDLIIPGKTGQLFPFSDTKALANRMLEMAADKPGLAEMGHQAREHVSGHYTVANAVRGVLAAVRAVTAGP